MATLNPPKAPPEPDVPEPDLVDWDLAARVGRRVAGGSELLVRAAWSRQFTDLSTRADAAVADYTGLGGELPPPVAEPLDRGQWVEANLATLKRVLNPVKEKVIHRPSWEGAGPLPALARTGTQMVTGVQAGALLGYIAQRVLGQYDLPLPDPSIAEPEGTVFYVVPNIVGLERRHGFRPADFRLWIALHETAHRRQFRGVSWLPAHMQGLLDEFLASVDLDEDAIQRISRRAQDLVRKVLAGEPVEAMDFLASPEQRAVVDRIQATMSVLEGHGEFVMQELGERLVPGHDRMHQVLHDRRLTPNTADRVLQQALGLRKKLEQYSRGEHFVRHAYDRGGMDAVNRVFSEPAALPSPEELTDPDRWLARI